LVDYLVGGEDEPMHEAGYWRIPLRISSMNSGGCGGEYYIAWR